jgi:hypothetical protein
MSFRPSKGRAPYVAISSGGAVASSFLKWSQTFYPEQMESTGTAVRADLAFGTLGLLNVYNMTNDVCQIFFQGMFHPYYDSGDVTLKVAFHCPNSNPVGARSLDVGITAWDVAGDTTLDRVITLTTISKAQALPGDVVLYFPVTALAVQGVPAPGATWEVWMKRSDSVANSVYISAAQISYNLTKKVV